MHEDWRDMYIAQKTAQSGHTSVEVEVQPLDQSLPYHLSEFKPWNKRTLCTVSYLCVGLFQMQTAKVTVLIVKDSNV